MTQWGWLEEQGVVDMPDYGKVNFSKAKRIPFDLYFPNACQEELDLITSMLRYEDRITIEEVIPFSFGLQCDLASISEFLSFFGSNSWIFFLFVFPLVCPFILCFMASSHRIIFVLASFYWFEQILGHSYFDEVRDLKWTKMKIDISAVLKRKSEKVLSYKELLHIEDEPKLPVSLNGPSKGGNQKKI